MKIQTVAAFFLLLSICTLDAKRPWPMGKPKPTSKIVIDYADIDMLELYQGFLNGLKRESSNIFKEIRYRGILVARTLKVLAASKIAIKICFMKNPVLAAIPCADRAMTKARQQFDDIKAAGEKRKHHSSTSPPLHGYDN